MIYINPYDNLVIYELYWEVNLHDMYYKAYALKYNKGKEPELGMSLMRLLTNEINMQFDNSFEKL